MTAAILILAFFIEIRLGGTDSMTKVNVTEVLCTGFLLGGLLVGLVQSPTTWSARLRRLARVNPWVSAHAAWMLVAGAAVLLLTHRVSPLQSLRDAIPGLVLFCLLASGSDRGKFDVWLVKASIYSGTTALAVLALVQYYWGTGYMNPVNPDAYFKHAIDGFSLVRNPAVGTLGHPNGLAMFLCVGLILACGWLAADLRKLGITVTDLWRIAIICIAGWALYATQAKMVMLVAAVGALSAGVGCCIPRRPSRGHLFTLLGILVGLSITVGMSWIREQIDGTDNVLGTLMYRVYLSAIALSVITSSVFHAIFGGGGDTFRQLYPTDLGVHTEYLAQVLDHGLLGGALFAAALAHGIWSAVELRWEVCTALVCLAGLLLVESASGTQVQGLIYLLLGLSAQIGANGRPRVPPKRVTA